MALKRDKSRAIPRVCVFYNQRIGCAKSDCRFLHLCQFFVVDKCKFENCKRNHSLTEKDKVNVTQSGHDPCQQTFWDKLAENVMAGLDLSVLEENPLPNFCAFYNSNKGCDKGYECAFVHLCKFLVAGNCDNRPVCPHYHTVVGKDYDLLTRAGLSGDAMTVTVEYVNRLRKKKVLRSKARQGDFKLESRSRSKAREEMRGESGEKVKEEMEKFIPRRQSPVANLGQNACARMPIGPSAMTRMPSNQQAMNLAMQPQAQRQGKYSQGGANKLAGGGPQQTGDAPNSGGMMPNGTTKTGGQKKLAIDAQQLATWTPQQQKQTLGEYLYPIIVEMHGRELAGRITAMLLELDNSDLMDMLQAHDEGGEELKKKVDEAVTVIRAQAAREAVQSVTRQTTGSAANSGGMMPNGTTKTGRQKKLAIDAQQLATYTPAQQKQKLGENMYPIIAEMQGVELAGRITGMLLELDNSDLADMLQAHDEGGEELKKKVDEAVTVIRAIKQKMQFRL